MLKKTIYCAFLGLSLVISQTFASRGEITLTIDDLPFVGNANRKPGNLRRESERFMRILNTIKQYNIPATGFVVAGSIESGQWELLQKFHDAGLLIGNHTYSHRSLNRTSADNYMKGIGKADSILSPLLSNPKYFRYPYLSEGRGAKKQKVIDYLKSTNYVIVPVTVDSKDFKFNERLLNIHWRKRKFYLNSIKKRYLSFIWSQTIKAEKRAQKKVNRPIKHILLIHNNLLNSHFLADIIEMYQSKGYRFIGLDEALSDPYYKEKEKQASLER